MRICEISEIFKNASSTQVDVYVVSDPTVEGFLRATNTVFRRIDRQDDQQIEISRRLWLLRATVLYTLNTFSYPRLGLNDQAKELVDSVQGYPDLLSDVNVIFDRVKGLLNLQENPKKVFLDKKIVALDGVTMLMTRMSGGGSPGWPDRKEGGVVFSGLEVKTFHSVAELNNLPVQIIIPGGIRNVPIELAQKVFFSSVTSSIIVCSYQGEGFKLPTRLDMRSDNILLGVAPVEVRNFSVEPCGDQVSDEIDTWVNEQFWIGLHGGDRESRDGKEASRYVLFSNGMGCCFPEAGSVLSTKNVTSSIGEFDIRNTKVSRLADGDWILLREGYAGSNLDETSDMLLEERGDEALLEKATDWKLALDALTLTKSFQEISTGLELLGSVVNPRVIRQWLNDEVLGPANLNVFDALIKYMAAEGKIKHAGPDLNEYITSRWNLLQEFRGLRHKAGNIIRKKLIDRLVDLIGAADLASTACTEFKISNDESSSLLFLRVEMVDNAISYVSPSRFGQLDDLRSNRWLA